MFYALLCAGILMVLWDNKTLYDIGFQLSFGAMAGLALFYPVFRRLFYRITRFSPATLFDVLPASLAANVAIFPILAYHFGQFSFLSPLANFFVLPAIPLIMLGGFFTEATGLLVSPLWLFCEYTIRMISLFGGL